MYRKILVGFVIVLIFLLVTPFVYLMWVKSNPSSSQYQQLGELGSRPVISVHFKNYATDEMFDVELNQTKPEVTIDPEQSGLAYFGKHFRGIALLFVCQATFPVQWKYDGSGDLNMQMSFERIFDSEGSGYKFNTTILIRSIREQNSGTLTCIGFKNSEPNATVHLYVKGSRTFVMDDVKTLEVDNGDPVIIPCPISDPSNQRIALYRSVFGSSSGSRLMQLVSEHAEFNPRIGFVIDNNSIIAKAPWGTYTCKNEESGETSAPVHVYKPLKEIVRVSSPNLLPNYQMLPNDSWSKYPIKLECRSIYDIKLEVESITNYSKNNDSFNKSRAYPYKSRMVIPNPKELSSESTVRCVTKGEDQRVLKTWRFHPDENYRPSLTYNSNEKNYVCCVPAGNPKLHAIPCYSNAECKIRSRCLTKLCRNVEQATNEISNKKQYCEEISSSAFSQGILDCSSYERRRKTFTVFAIPDSNLQVNSSGTSLKEPQIQMITQKKILLLQTSFGRERRVPLDQIIYFYCLGPKFFVANGFRWKLEFQDNTSTYLSSNGKDATHPSEVQERLSITFTNSSIRSITCEAPEIESTGWLATSMVLYY